MSPRDVGVWRGRSKTNVEKIVPVPPQDLSASPWTETTEDIV